MNTNKETDFNATKYPQLDFLGPKKDLITLWQPSFNLKRQNIRYCPNKNKDSRRQAKLGQSTKELEEN
jgi:hypothetical protein